MGSLAPDLAGRDDPVFLVTGFHLVLECLCLRLRGRVLVRVNRKRVDHERGEPPDAPKVVAVGHGREGEVLDLLLLDLAELSSHGREVAVRLGYPLVCERWPLRPLVDPLLRVAPDLGVEPVHHRAGVLEQDRLATGAATCARTSRTRRSVIPRLDRHCLGDLGPVGVLSERHLDGGVAPVVRY